MKKRTRLLALLLCLIMMFTVAAPALFAPQAQAASTSSSKQTTIKLNKTKASVYNGKTLKLKVSGTKKTVTWSTSNKAIATVSKKGVVTPKKPGTVKIKAQVAGKTLTCKVTVKSPLRVSKQELTIEKGKTAKIKVALHLDDGDVNCKIADRSIASYSFGAWDGYKINLKFKGKKVGTTTAKITNTETKDKVVVKITVKNPTPTVTKKALKAAATSVSLDRGASKTIALTAAPSANINVSVADPSVASCKWSGKWNGDQSAVTLTGLKKGSTTVTLTNATTKEVVTLQVTVICKHVYSDTYKVVIAPTCTAAGLEESSCIYCGERGATRSIPATGHTFAADYTIDVPATCKSEGVQSRHCTKCDAKVDEKPIPKTTHFFSSEFTVDVEPTCTTAGSKSRHCQNCDDKYEVTEIPATGHSFGAYTTTKEATCQAAGTETRTCTVCGQKEERTIPQKEHEYSTTFTTDTPASCTTAGSKSKHCIYCSAKTEVTEIPATGHSFGEWVESGDQLVRTCSSCGYQETKEKTPEPGETFQNPLSGQSGQVIEFQEYSSKPVRKVKITLKNVVTGDAANDLAESENHYNTDAGNGYSWRFFIFDVTYVSTTGGANDVLDAEDIIYKDTFFKSTGSAVQQKGMATLGSRFGGSGVFDVEMYPGSTSEVVFALLMRDDSGDVLLRVPKNGGKENTWISMTAPELVIEDETPPVVTAEPDSVENIAAYAMAITKFKMKNPSSFSLQNIVYKNSETELYYNSMASFDSYNEKVVFVWYTERDENGAVVDRYTHAWYSDKVFQGFSKTSPYYNVPQSDGGYIVVWTGTGRRPDVFDGYVDIKKAQSIESGLGVVSYTANWAPSTY